MSVTGVQVRVITLEDGEHLTSAVRKYEKGKIVLETLSGISQPPKQTIHYGKCLEK